jgi:hypothetical protein
MLTPLSFDPLAGAGAAVLSHGATLIDDSGTTLIPQGPKSQ